MRKQIRRQKGSLMIEAIVSLAAVIITVAAISVIVTLGVSNTGFIKDQNKASKYAQEGMEYLRSLEQNNYSSFIATYLPSGLGSGGQNSYCLGNDINDVAGFIPSSAPPCNRDDDMLDSGKFKREVNVIDQSSSSTAECAGGVEVVVTVRWLSGRCDVSKAESFCHNSTLTSCFTNIAPTP
jgi:hypothetical protein